MALSPTSLLGAAGDGGYSGSSSASASATTNIANTVNTGTGLNIFELLIAVVGLIVLGLIFTLRK